MRWLWVSLVVALLAVPRGADADSEKKARAQLQKAIKDVWAGKQLRRGKTAVYIVDARTGAELYKVHTDVKLNVASNVKLLSTAAVLDTLGQDWVYTTRVLGAAPDKDGVSKGDVYLRGMSDPTLSVSRLREMALDLRLSGVDVIKGDVVLSSSVYRDTIGFPHVEVRVKGASRAGNAPSVDYWPKSDFIKLEVKAKTTGRRRARINVKTKLITDKETKAHQLVVSVTGTIRRNQSHKVRRGVHKRSTFTAYTFREMLKAAGIEVEGGVRIEELDQFVATATEAGYLPVELASTKSKPMSALVSKVNKRSLNYLSDRLVMSAGAYVKGGTPSMSKAVDVMHDWLRSAGIDPKKVVVDTGSGLSYETQISVRQIVRILRTSLGFQAHAGDGPICTNSVCYANSLSIGGVDGTLRRRFRSNEVKGKVIGKTGTLTGVIALSGVVSYSDDNELAFAIVTNGNSHGNRWNVRKEHEKMVRAMYEYLEARAEIRERQPEPPAAEPEPATVEEPAGTEPGPAEAEPPIADTNADDNEQPDEADEADDEDEPTGEPAAGSDQPAPAAKKAP